MFRRIISSVESYISPENGGDRLAAAQTAVPTRSHDLSLHARQQLTLNGVNSVEGFDESEIRTLTELGRLTISGKQLRISRFCEESGELFVEGTVDALIYSDGTTADKRGFWSKLLG